VSDVSPSGGGSVGLSVSVPVPEPLEAGSVAEGLPGGLPGVAGWVSGMPGEVPGVDVDGGVPGEPGSAGVPGGVTAGSSPGGVAGTPIESDGIVSFLPPSDPHAQRARVNIETNPWRNSIRRREYAGLLRATGSVCSMILTLECPIPIASISGKAHGHSDPNLPAMTSRSRLEVGEATARRRPEVLPRNRTSPTVPACETARHAKPRPPAQPLATQHASSHQLGMVDGQPPSFATA